MNPDAQYLVQVGDGILLAEDKQNDEGIRSNHKGIRACGLLILLSVSVPYWTSSKMFQTMPSPTRNQPEKAQVMARIQSCRTIGGSTLSPSCLRRAPPPAMLAPGPQKSLIPRPYPLHEFRMGPSKILSRAFQPESIASSLLTSNPGSKAEFPSPWRRAFTWPD
ncbi:hypothetical protein E2P81_ATG05871 [Venturia nashicola]|uniref:Uncharacterized protein n=1 Tax=Venturia nashicola TaxID=86259 RepID=A0A4Z1NT03_9PEZI|nr:hypothetical protein E6O75_ATG06017 [Venturia nashicola]TLD29577.1 hypothetical protein E2P81_ATG05871 [Venturia nashicola]